MLTIYHQLYWSSTLSIPRINTACIQATISHGYLCYGQISAGDFVDFKFKPGSVRIRFSAPRQRETVVSDKHHIIFLPREWRKGVGIFCGWYVGAYKSYRVSCVGCYGTFCCHLRGPKISCDMWPFYRERRTSHGVMYNLWDEGRERVCEFALGYIWI